MTLLWEGFTNESSSLGGSGSSSGGAGGQKRKRNSYEKAFLRVGERLERDIVESKSMVKVKDFGQRTLSFVEYH